MDIGARLREARESAGLSRHQIADATKVKLERIEALEDNAFERLPSGIYLHGMIRSYAHEVGLDAEELIHQLRTSRDNPDRKAELAHLALLAELRSRHAHARADVRADAVEASGHQPVAPGAGRRRMHTAALAALVVVLLGAFATGGYLYKTAAVERTRAQSRQSQDPQVSKTSGSQLVPAETPQVHVSSPADADQTRSQPTASPHAIGSTGVTSKTARDPHTQVGQNATAPDSSADESKHGAESGEGVTGVWRISTQIAKSDVSAFRGLRLGFVVDLRQDGNRIVGSGRKVSENGSPLAPAARTPITVEGTKDGDQVTLTFTERGAGRESTGTFQLTLAADDLLRGRFSSDAARSAGTVEARRQ